jgi:O-antigen/teichoic acid export membrane protein
VTIATTISRFGLDNLLVRNVASYSQQEKWDNIAGLSRQSIRLALCTSTACAVVIAFGAESIASMPSKVLLVETLRVMAWSVIPLTVMMLCAEMLRGLQKNNLAMFIQLSGVPLVSGLLCLCVIARFGQLNLHTVAIIYTSATVAICILSIATWMKSMPPVKAVETPNYWVLLNQSSSFFGVTIINLALNSIDILLLGIWTDSQTVAIYGVATRIASLTAFFLGGVNAVVAPKFSILYANGQYDKLAYLSGQASAITIALTLPLLVPLFCFPQLFMSFFGVEYVNSSSVLLILVIGQLFNALAGSVGCLLLMTGREKLMQLNLASVALVSTIMNIIVIPRFGIIGAAAVSSLSLTLLNFISSVLVYKQFSMIVSPLLCFNFAKD